MGWVFTLRSFLGMVPAMIIANLTATSLLGSTGLGLAEMWEMTPSQAVWLQSAFMIGFVFRAPIGLFVTNLINDRLVFLLALALVVVSNGLFYLYAETFTVSFILLFIAGAAASAMIIPAFNFIGHNGALFGGMTVGFACAIGWAASIFLSGLTAQIDIAVILPFLEAGGGWSTIFLLTTIFAFVWLLIALFLLPKRR